MAKRDEPKDTEFPLLKDDFVPDVSEKDPPPANDLPPGPTPPPAKEPKQIARASFASRLAETDPEPRIVPARSLKLQTRRDFLLYGAGAAAAIAGFWWALPEDTQHRLGAPMRDPRTRQERFLNG